MVYAAQKNGQIWGSAEVLMSTYQAASGAGAEGMAELENGHLDPPFSWDFEREKGQRNRTQIEAKESTRCKKSDCCPIFLKVLLKK